MKYAVLNFITAALVSGDDVILAYIVTLIDFDSVTPF
jgi:hypothetical protein